MKTTDEIAELLELALGQLSRAKRIERELGKDPGAALLSARATALSAVRAINERVPPPMVRRG